MIKKLQTRLKEELKLGNKTKINAYRNMIGKLKAHEIDSKKTLDDKESIKILHKMSKQIKDSIEQFKAGGRHDLVESENSELKIIESFLPKQLTKEEIEKLVSNIITENKATNLSDLGKIMGLVMKEIAGKGDGKLASKLVKDQLSK